MFEKLKDLWNTTSMQDKFLCGFAVVTLAAPHLTIFAAVVIIVYFLIKVGVGLYKELGL